MAFHTTEGADKLRELSLDDVKKLITKKSLNEIAKEFNVSEYTAQKITSQKFSSNLQIGFKRDINPDWVSYSREPFSDSEEDYGGFVEFGRHRITNNGIYMESEIVDSPTPIQLAIRNYKNVLEI
jgi:hypothetical protein